MRITTATVKETIATVMDELVTILMTISEETILPTNVPAMHNGMAQKIGATMVSTETGTQSRHHLPTTGTTDTKLPASLNAAENRVHRVTNRKETAAQTALQNR
jgi:hypothetical protein